MKECPVCLKKIKQLNPRHIKKCFQNDKNYRFKYITAIISANDYIDISSKNSPFNTLLNTQVISVSATEIVVPLNSECQIGDYISLEGYSAFAQIPQEIISLLVQASIVKIMESIS